MSPGSPASWPTSLSALPGYWPLSEPPLAFDPVDRAAIDVHPLRGLDTFGPQSGAMLALFLDVLRVAMLAPSADLPRLRAQLNEVTQPQEPRERPEYLPTWRGFSKVFRVPLRPASSTERSSS